MDSTEDLDNSKDSFFDDDNEDDIMKDETPPLGSAKPATKAPAGKAPLEDSAKNGPDPRPKKEYTEADIDRELDSDSLDIDHGTIISPINFNVILECVTMHALIVSPCMPVR